MMVVCHKCSGDGFTVEPVCCQRRGEPHGECCGEPIPQQEQCKWCGGEGRIEITEMSE